MGTTMGKLSYTGSIINIVADLTENRSEYVFMNLICVGLTRLIADNRLIVFLLLTLQSMLMLQNTVAYRYIADYVDVIYSVVFHVNSTRSVCQPTVRRVPTERVCLVQNERALFVTKKRAHLVCRLRASRARR